MKTIWYTRCPVATASGIAFQRGLFDEEFAGSDYEVRNIKELGRDKMASHFDHGIDAQFREGGTIPPLWARQNGADTQLVGLTFVADSLRIYVRPQDGLTSFNDLKGKRLGIANRPKDMIDFMRVNGHKAFSSALEVHGMTEEDVELTPIYPQDDIQAGLNPNYSKDKPRDDASHYEAEIKALVAGEVDAFFAKNAECEYIERKFAGKITPIYDVLSCDQEELKVNANPRIISVSGALARDYPEATIRYLQVLVRTAAWAADHAQEAAETMAIELGVEPGDIAKCYEPDFHKKLWPNLSTRTLNLLDNQQSFMAKHGYLKEKVPLDGWLNDTFLRQAYHREGLPWVE